MRFAGAVVRCDFLDATMWLKRRIKHRRLSRVESFGNLGYGHHICLRNPGDIDKSLGNLMKEAYSVGQQATMKGGDRRLTSHSRHNK
jgi:hypothetical protein